MNDEVRCRDRSRRSTFALDEGQRRVGLTLVAIVVSAWGTAAMVSLVDIRPEMAALSVSVAGLLAFLTVIADD